MTVTPCDFIKDKIVRVGKMERRWRRYLKDLNFGEAELSYIKNWEKLAV